MGDTTIRVSEELADELYQRKGRGVSYEELIWSLLDEENSQEVETVTDAEREPEPEPQPATTAPVGDIDRVVEEVAEGWDDSRERLQQRKAAAQAVIEYAREHAGVSKQEAKEYVYPEQPVDGQNERTWYRKNIRPVLNEIAEYDQSKRKYTLQNQYR